MVNYISLERLSNVDLEKKIWIAGFFNSAKENRKQPRKWPCMCNSIELIGYQIQVCEHFLIFWLVWLFLINLSSSNSKEYAKRIALNFATGEILYINFKNWSPTNFGFTEHLRNVQAKFHSNPPNFDTLLIHLSDWITQGHFRGHYYNFILRKTPAIHFFPEIEVCNLAFFN